MSVGVTDGRLRAAVRAGSVLALGDGVFSLPDAAQDVVVAATLRGSLTCVSAASMYGLDVLVPAVRPHVAVPLSNSRRSDDAEVHRRKHCGSGLLVPLVCAVADTLCCMPPVQALVVVDSAIRDRKTTVPAIEACLRGPGSVRPRQLLRLADGRSGSAPETVVRAALVLAGLEVEPQVKIPGVGRVDLLVDKWLVVEVDGYEFHSGREQYRNDRRRANALVAQGYVLLRFSYEDVMSGLDRLVAQVSAVLAAR